MTDFIREVEHASKFRGRVQYEPLHLQFIPIRRNVIDVIEVQVGETNGKGANFAGGSVILTLKFERRNLSSSTVCFWNVSTHETKIESAAFLSSDFGIEQDQSETSIG